jgi:hypothetical protein
MRKGSEKDNFWVVTYFTFLQCNKRTQGVKTVLRTFLSTL